MSYRIEIDPNDPQSIQRALNTEWLLTNGLGGYAMGTALGVNTRRYHGLLVAATKPPVGRIVALHSMIEQLVIPRDDGSEEVIDLSTQQFVEGDGQPMLHPDGWRTLRSFSNGNARQIWNHEFSAGTLERELNVRSADNGLNILYRLQSTRDRVTLRVRPIIALRDFHAIEAHQGSHESLIVRVEENPMVTFRRGELAFSMHAWADEEHPNAAWKSDSQVWHSFCYVKDRERGQGWVESIQSPGFFEFSIKRGQRPVILSAVLSRPGFSDPRTEDGDLADVNWGYAHNESVQATLKHSCWQFCVRRSLIDGISTSVIAGYPWFGDWGRDTMIALPGLLLCTGREVDARSCLLMFARHLRDGLIPNLFDDYGGAAHYNTVDASLWFVHAAHELWNGMWKRNRQIEPAFLIACRRIVAAYKGGTDFNIYMDHDGLISAGEEGSQLTWMDAKRDGVVFTPRHGKAVEINALWFNALNCLAEMTTDSAEREELLALSRKVADSFRAKFWWQDGGRGCLFDVLTPNAKQKIRPNQIFAVSLPFSPLYEDQQRAVVKIVEDKLLTPFGLRTLDRDDPEYRGRYEGDLFERDRAYHNGTVWPWLIGPYCEAVLRVNKFNDQAKQRVRATLQPLIDEMSNTEGGRCLGQIAEVYDGDAPHRPGGCPAQAWSVAEVLRILKLVESSKGLGT
jgi:predicted glycogen debranching enzyme